MSTELGEFLRSSRERLTPEAVGLPPGRRRRTPGLRREEVAALAGISIEYLIRLEQGRDTNPSAAVLAALSDTLRLTEAERAHLGMLSIHSRHGEMCPEKTTPIEEVAPNFWRAVARYGFMERPDIPALLRQAHTVGCGIDLDDVTYYIGRETIVGQEDAGWLSKMRMRLFALMERNSSHVTDFCRVPPESVVEIGREVAI